MAKGGDPYQILSRLRGVRRTGPNTWVALCPAHDDRNPSLSIKATGDRVLLYCFAGCSYENILQALDLDIPLPAKEPYKPLQPVYFSKKWQGAWEEAEPIYQGSKAMRYFNARGIRQLPPTRNLRFHPSLPYHHDGKLLGYFPAILALVQDEHGNPVNVHRTYLAPTCDAKAPVPAPKKLFPGQARGGIYLGPRMGAVVVGEGIETTLAAWAMTGLSPIALISAPGMASWVPPGWVQSVLIAADADKAGVRAAKQLATRLLDMGLRVTIRTPPEPKMDWLDGLQQGTHIWF